MCKYCKLETINAYVGEKTTDNKTIAKIKDGSQLFELYLNRYIVEEENIHKQALVMNYSVDMPDGCVYSLKEKRINIKYCPFCGEEL